jgi:hypothetical protein
MSRKDEEPISGEKYEFELTRHFELGIGSGWEQAGKILLDKATDYFKKKEDSTAILLRKLSEEITKKGEELAEAARQKRLESEK